VTAPAHPIIREALAAHEVFRKLGFMPDEIFIRPRPNELFVTVQRAGKEFNLSLGAHDLDMVAVIKQWADATAWWNTGDNGERQELFDRSEVRKNVVPIIVSLTDKGFAIKRSDA
jgi:hypothetical protein